MLLLKYVPTSVLTTMLQTGGDCLFSC